NDADAGHDDYGAEQTRSPDDGHFDQCRIYLCPDRNAGTEQTDMSDNDNLHILVTDQTGTNHRLDALEGWSAMEIMRHVGLDIKAGCGGCRACATCCVYVDPDWIGRVYPRRDEETGILESDAFAVAEPSRLSCQILFTEELNGLRLTLAPGTGKEA